MTRIILPEYKDERILKAAELITKKKIAKIIIPGNDVEEYAKKHKVSLKNIEIINPEEYYDKFAKLLFRVREKKGMTLAKAKELVKDINYFSVLAVKSKFVDGMVSGAMGATAKTLRPAFQIIKTKKGIASGAFLMEVGKKKFIFADCAVNPDPDFRELAKIAEDSAETYETLVGKKPKIAMLSFSTKGSAKHDMIEKVRKATKLVNKKYIVDGEIQLDAAIDKYVAKKKCPNSKIKGDANVLVFPDLNSGNIGYKLVQRFGKAKAIGPILQGLNMPVNDLSRGCSIDDIVDVVRITAKMVNK